MVGRMLTLAGPVRARALLTRFALFARPMIAGLVISGWTGIAPLGLVLDVFRRRQPGAVLDRKSTRLNSSH